MHDDTVEAGYSERNWQARVSAMKYEGGNEIFDDVYLGVRAGGALRKKRRGETLTA